MLQSNASVTAPSEVNERVDGHGQHTFGRRKSSGPYQIAKEDQLGYSNEIRLPPVVSLISGNNLTDHRNQALAQA